jgi:DNA mismatch repair protein MutS
MQSLLWPDGAPPASAPPVVAPEALQDLELVEVAGWLAEARPERRPFVLELLSRLPTDPAVCRHRREVVADLLAQPRLADGLREAERALHLLATHRPEVWPRDAPRASRIGARVVELAAYVEAVQALRRAFAVSAPASVGLRRLAADVEAVAQSPEFQALERELPRWRQSLDEVRSITIAVNVSPALEPESAAIVDFSPRPAGPASTALARLLGEDTGRRGVVRLFRRQPVDWQADDRLAQGVRALLEAVATPVEQALHRYRLVGAQALAFLQDELLVLLGATAMARRWRAAGLPVCLAEVTRGPGQPEPDEEPDWVVEDAYHPVLAFRLPEPAQVVPNRIAFGRQGRVWVLTGPNRGGKTTYLRTVGVVQVLGQAGLPVPAARARIRAVDRLVTHFPAPEANRPGMGRLDEEAERVARVFATCTRDSLALLNEVLAGTSAPEATALATDVLRGFRVLGLSAVYATHLHEVAARTEEINASVAGPARVASLTVETEPEGVPELGMVVRRPTYRVVPGPPTGASYFASEIARRHGISLPQILERLRARGLLPAEEPTPPPRGEA